MTAISATMVRDLREKTGAGMMDCKKALIECGGDAEAAVDWLRKKGLAAAAKKAGRTAAEGLVGVATSGTKGAVVEVNAETDFVARNDVFQDFVKNVAEIALSTGDDIENLKAADFPGKGHSISEELTALISKIGENMSLRRVQTLEVDKGVVSGYIHNQVAPGLGKIGVIVALESEGDTEKLEAFAKQLAMHIAAVNPASLSTDELDPALVERERNVLIDQARASGKPEEIIEKMIEGRIRKYYEEVVFLEQTFVVDGENKVRKAVELFAKDLGAPVEVKGFHRMQLGEGIEKEESDFAAEVAATLK